MDVSAPAPTDADDYRHGKYLPDRHREGVALCLSGGGFRAALFHLGALTWLNEAGALARVTTITSVSGGSIVAALLADRLGPWLEAGTPVPQDEWRAGMIDPLVAFTSRDLRTGPVAAQLWPWNWFRRGAGARHLAAHYAAAISARPLTELPRSPRFVFCATDLVFGVNYTFERDRVGSYRAECFTPTGPDDRVALAVAASSCFPPIFKPLPVGRPARDYRARVAERRRLPDWATDVSAIELTDGGDYDNLGLEPVWKTHRSVLVSDGGAPFQVARDRGLPWRLQRYAEIATNQAGALRKRWLVSSYLTGSLHGAYWGVSSSAGHYSSRATGYPEDLVRERIASVRTDMDVFTEAEAEVLQNHGYTLAAAALGEHAAELVGGRPAPATLPYPAWADPGDVDRALRDSARRRIGGHEPLAKLPLKILRG